MAFFEKDDLKLSYKWTSRGTGDDPTIRDRRDRVFVSRHEGWEILPFINAMAKKMNLQDKADGHYLEYLMRKQLPANIRARKKVSRWIEDHWDKCREEFNLWFRGITAQAATEEAAKSDPSGES